MAQRAFAKIAGDQDLVDFLNTAAKDIRHQAIINAVVQLAAALLITLATGMGAAALGARAAAALATEGSGLAMRGIAVAADLATNVTINTAVQLAISRPTRRRRVDASGNEIEESDGAIVGSMLLENLLMDGFMRTLSRPLRKAHDTLRAEARELSALPNLTPDERRVLSSFSFAGTQMSVELVGGMTTQWAAHQLVETARMKGEEISEPFALTVLQQGAAIGLGKFFHGQLSAWEAHRAALAKTRIGRSPGAKALFAARDAFYARAKALSESLSPDPAAMNELLHTNEALVQQERALVASLASQDVDAGSHGVATHVEAGPLPHGSPTLERPGTHHADAAGSSARTDAARAEPATVKASDTLDHVGARIAAAAGARYVGDGEFEIDAPSGTISIEVRRTSRRSRFHVEGNRAVIEIERGLAAHEFERAVVDRLKAIREQGQGHVAHGSRDRVASSEIESASRRKVTDAEGAIAVRRPHADGGGSGSDGHGSGGGHDDGGPHGPGKSQPSAGEHIDSRYLDTYREDAAHWQAKALDEDPRAAALRSDPEFRKWFGKWMSQPKRFDGNKPRYPEGIPDHVRKQLDLVVEKGNIDLLTRSFEIADLIKRKFPGMPLDPTSAEWLANRRALEKEFTSDAVARFEQAVMVGRGDPSRAQMDQRLDAIVSRSDLDQLAARFPGAQVYITGSAAQDKPIANVTDIDLIIVVAENTPTAVRREFEKLVGRCRLGRGPEAAKYGSEPFEVDVKVMVQSEFAGWAMAGPGEPRGGKPRTPLVNVRIDKPGSGELPGTGATGVDLHNHVMGVLGTDYFIQKVGQGSAVNALENTWRAMHDTKHWKQGKAEVKPEIFAELERARLDIKRHRGDMPPEALEARARRALDRVLAASDRVAFDKTYDIRDILVQDYVDAGGELFENLATDTLTALHDQGVTYSEQSVSMKKLRNRLDPETMRRAHERAARQGKDTDLRFLAMLSTKDVLSAQDAHGTRLDQQDKAFGETLDQVKELLARGDVAGIDLAGPEAQEFTRRGMANFKALLDALAVAGKQRGRPLVLRPHVGEGYDSDHSGSHVETARRNLELLLTVLDEAGYHNPESGVIVRFGHAAHATPKQIEHMKRLGIVVEANIGSNLATGSVANADQHPLLYNLYYGVETVLSTDAQGVMGTQLSIEYQRASALIAAFKSGETSLQIDGKIVRYADLSPEIKKRFDIETLKGWAKKYVDDVHAYDARDSARNKPSTPRP